MKGKIIKDWSKVDFNSKQDKSKVMAALQHFMDAPFKKDSKLYAAMQHFTTKGDFPAEIIQVIEKYHATNDYDLGYEQIFDIRDFTGTQESGFDILDVEDGLTFSEVPVGAKAKVYGMSGAKVNVPFVRYGGGLNWDRTLIDDRQYWQLEDNAIAFRNKAAYKKAKTHYELIEAVGATYDVAWQAPVPAALPNTDRQYNAIRDAETMNKAAENIVTDLKDSGLGVNMGSEMLVLVPYQLKGRIERALAVKAEGFAASPNQVNYILRPVYTTMLDVSDKYYVILPGRKLKGGNRQDLTIFGEFDILAYADTSVGWMRFGAAIGEAKQVRRCSIA